MDFTSQYDFLGNQPYHEFMPIPPLAPSHSHSAASDEFTTSPPEKFKTLPQANGQFRTFDYNLNFNTNLHQNFFPSPPTPPGQNVFASRQVPAQPQQYGTFSNLIPRMKDSDGSPGEGGVVARGTSEDDGLTHAQSRRKAQNRAAQRAFRERKGRHIKDLEAKLADLEAAHQQASAENERLKRDIKRMSTENEVLRANSGGIQKDSLSGPSGGLVPFNSTDSYSNGLQNHADKTPSHRIVTADDGERLPASGAGFIINHELYKKDLVDVGDVSERPKHCARYDGQGPVFSERSIIMAIEQGVSSGSDDLL